MKRLLIELVFVGAVARYIAANHTEPWLAAFCAFVVTFLALAVVHAIRVSCPG